MVGLICRKQNPSSRENRTLAVRLFMHLPHSCKTNENSDFLCFDIEDCNNVIICISTFVCIIHILTVNFNAKLSLILKKIFNRKVICDHGSHSLSSYDDTQILFEQYMGLDEGKTVRNFRTTRVQTSLCIRAV